MRASVTTGVATAVVSNTTPGGSDRDDWQTRSFAVKNMSPAKTSVFVDVAKVAAPPSAAALLSDGLEWETTDGPLYIDLEPGEALYGTPATATAQLMHSLGSGR